MEFRRAEKKEYESVKTFYWTLIDQMDGLDGTPGWKKGIYPSNEFLSESIKSGTLYILEDDMGIAASVVLNSMWNEGYDGLPWSVDCSQDEVLVPHALGVRFDAQKKGIGQNLVREIIEYAQLRHMKTIRLDILAGNVAAERLYTKMGFKYVQAKEMFYEDTGWTEYIMYELVLQPDDI